MSSKNKSRKCHPLYGVDSMLEIYDTARENIVNIFIEKPQSLSVDIWTVNSFLTADSSCRFSLFSEDETSKFVCQHCSNIRDMGKIKWNEGKDTAILKFECGKKFGEKMIITRKNNLIHFLRQDYLAQDIVREFIRKNENLMVCGYNNEENILIFSSDSFTAELIINYTTQRHFKELGLPHCLPYFAGFSCGKYNFLLREDPPMIEVDFRNPENITSILKQLIVISKTLSSLNFVSGPITEDSFMFADEKCHYIFEGIEIKSRFVLKFNCFNQSSARFKNKHIYVGSVSRELMKKFIVPKITTEEICDSDMFCEKSSWYIINEGNKFFFENIQHMGFSYFVNSYDTYRYILNFMNNQLIYKTVKDNPYLNTFWEKIWYQNEVPNMDLYHEQSNIEQILMERRLRCDLIDLSINYFKK